MVNHTITFEQIANNEEIRTYLRQGHAVLGAMGYTEHSLVHAGRVSYTAAHILTSLSYDARTVELARIAGYLHDIGNMAGRYEHAQTGAVFAFQLLRELGMDPAETGIIVSAIGNHDEGSGNAVNPVSAALILADKTDVRRSRVRNTDFASFDIHDRVNYAVVETRTYLTPEKTALVQEMTIDTEISPVMDYFEIFLDRMMLCRKAAERLGLKFRLRINGQNVL